MIFIITFDFEIPKQQQQFIIATQTKREIDIQ